MGSPRTSVKGAALFHGARKRDRIAFVVALLVVVALTIRARGLPHPPHHGPHHHHDTSLQLDEADEVRPNYLRFLIPGSRTDPKVCKTLLSGAVLGYPVPTLVNWEQPSNSSSPSPTKLDVILDHLKSHKPHSDDDLVIVADGHDVWFQLRPDVLITRYYDINRRADERTRHELGHSHGAHHYRQSIICATQKTCNPRGSSNSDCLAAAVSTPAGDLGSKIYLSSAFCIGPVSAVRAVFERAREKMAESEGEDARTADSALAEIYIEQQYQRKLEAMRHRGLLGKFRDWISKAYAGDYSYVPMSEDDATRQAPKRRSHDRLEFGLGVDYEMRIAAKAVPPSEYGGDFDWVSYGDLTHRLQAASTDTLAMPRVHDFSPDIATSRPPFYDMDRVTGTTSPKPDTWRDVPLFTDTRTGDSPVAVLHSSSSSSSSSAQGDDQSRTSLDADWAKTWFQSHSRTLLDARVLTAQRQVASVTLQHGMEQAWWGPTHWSWKSEWAGVATDTGEWVPYEELCSGAWEELFGDGKGDWRDPRVREPPPEPESPSQAETERKKAEKEKASKDKGRWWRRGEGEAGGEAE